MEETPPVIKEKKKPKRVSEYPRTGRLSNKKGYMFGNTGKVLDRRQTNLIKYYTDPSSPTFMDKKASALRAKYLNENIINESLGKNVRKAMELALERVGINDQMIAQRHKELLMKNDVRFNPETGEFIVTNQPDTVAVKAALDMVYKIRGDYAPEKSVTLTGDVGDILHDIQSTEYPIVRDISDKGKAEQQRVETEQPLLDS